MSSINVPTTLCDNRQNNAASGMLNNSRTVSTLLNFMSDSKM